MIEIVVDGVPSRVNVWQDGTRTCVSFAEGTTEKEATAIVASGVALLRPIDVALLFKEGGRRRAKRFIDSEE